MVVGILQSCVKSNKVEIFWVHLGLRLNSNVVGVSILQRFSNEIKYTIVFPTSIVNFITLQKCPIFFPCVHIYGSDCWK
jgi:hypothetical protein